MTSKQRIRAAMKGEPVDRPPIWLREGFNIGGDIQGEPMADVLGSGGDADFTLGWKLESLYRELFDYVSMGVGSGGVSEPLSDDTPRHIHREKIALDDDTVLVKGWVDTPRGRLTFVDKVIRNVNPYWHIEHLADSAAGLAQLAAMPFDFNPSVLDRYVASFRQKHAMLGDRGVMRIELPSPIVAISACMSEMLALGEERLILGSSAGLISAVSRKLVDNYKTWVDTALESV